MTKRVVRIALPTIAILFLVVTTYVKFREATWKRERSRNPKDAFVNGSIGTEFMPEPVFRALPELTPEYFQPRGKGHGDWIKQFGFTRSQKDNELPFGFTLSHYRPNSGLPSPVRFVGIGCATCHSTEIRIPERDKNVQVIGPGNNSLNISSFLEAVRSAILDSRLTPEAVFDIHRNSTGEALDFEQRLMIRLWLNQARSKARENLPKYGVPFSGPKSISSNHVPVGPSRTEPLQTLVRKVLNRPATRMKVYVKIPPVYWQGRQKWAQVDGSIRDLYFRSFVAAYGLGATFENTTVPEIEHNIKAASDYTRDLSGPRWADVFTRQEHEINRERARQGRTVYKQHCFSCHGGPAPDGTGWRKGPRQGEVIPQGKIRTDPERVSHRYYTSLPNEINDIMPSYHPFHIPRTGIRPGPKGEVAGYQNKPLEAVFAQAPYLHNGSVPTLAELINLKKRRDVFYRGRNFYDPERVGLRAPSEPTERAYFKFDTSRPGNSNSGHNYPWSYDDPRRNEEALRNLLEYLKTL